MPAEIPDVLGTMLRINRTSYEVVGVMPARLRHVEGEQPQLFFPIPLDNQEALLARWLTVIARLKPDVTLERSQGEMSVLANRIEEKLPERNQGWTTRVIPLREQFVGDTNPMLFAVFWGCLSGVADCLCQCGEPGLNPGPRQGEGNRCPINSGSQPSAAHPPAGYRESIVGFWRSAARTCFGELLRQCFRSSLAPERIRDGSCLARRPDLAIYSWHHSGKRPIGRPCSGSPHFPA